MQIFRVYLRRKKIYFSCPTVFNFARFFWLNKSYKVKYSEDGKKKFSFRKWTLDKLKCKVEKLLGGLIPSPSPSVKIQIIGGKVYLR